MSIMSSDPEVMDFEEDNLFGKKRRRRRKAQRAAKKAGRKKGLRGKKLRRFARAARQKVRGEQLRARAAKKGGRRGRRLIRKATRIEARKGQTAVGRGIRAATFAPLAPFRKPMQKALRRAGVANPPRKLRDLAPMFFKKIVKRNSYEVSDNVEPVTVTAIISAIIAFFKNMKNRKEQGQPLPPIGEIVADGAQKVTSRLSKKFIGQDISQGFKLPPSASDLKVKALEKLVSPLQPVMSSSLRTAGVRPPSGLKDLTLTFYNRIVKKNANNYIGLDYADGDEIQKENVLFETVVPAVIGFISSLKRKKASGQKTTKLEDLIVDKTQKVEANIKDAAGDEAAKRAGKFVLKPTTMMIIGVAAVALIFLIGRRGG